MDTIANNLGLNSETFVGPAWVTLAYFGVYYAFITHGLTVKLRLTREHEARGEKFDRYFSQDRSLLAADRTQLNMLEHMPVFLALLWLHATLVSSAEATVLGALYVVTRVLYPFLLAGRLGRNIPFRLLFSTFAGYGVLLVLVVRIVMNL